MNVWPPIVRVADRAVPLLAPVVQLTVPLPLPLAPEVMVSQGALLVAVHAQPAAAVTATLPVAPEAGALALVGAIENVQPVPWFRVKVCPAIVSVPERAPPDIAAAAYWTGPLPLPLAPDETVSHESLLFAVQAQPGAVVTATLPVPPDAGTLALVGAIENMQPLPCVTVIWEPATLIVPLRAAPVSAATVKAMPPLPLPEVGPVSVIHETPLDAVQLHPLDDSTVAEPAPPWAPNDCLIGSTRKSQPFDWVMLTVCPATTTRPAREGPAVASTVIRTDPGPVPAAPCAMVAQGILLPAVQGQPAAVATETVVEPPFGPAA